MRCTYCGRDIVLVPSAKERAKKYGKPAKHYTNLFTIHEDCQIQKRNAELSKLLTSKKGKAE